jgi:hypothetical protein
MEKLWYAVNCSLKQHDELDAWWNSVSFFDFLTGSLNWVLFLVLATLISTILLQYVLWSFIYVLWTCFVDKFAKTYVAVNVINDKKVFTIFTYHCKIDVTIASMSISVDLNWHHIFNFVDVFVFIFLLSVVVKYSLNNTIHSNHTSKRLTKFAILQTLLAKGVSNTVDSF